ncbi:phenylalanine--tRNA ligase subunit beta [Bacillaceae bacterium SIJ1]|uniref:phenylalanine--tRNA ligase subunit beta n=1 Tax=Litoribacterium kuwaitense TaxID=1398745 RepID=UPI0013ED8050|nr:phenylalanine--tRNA ligase subunit beta [Litoribacterium kuwaitense]NGP44999.1 phenylalanine--tRNA ligase subunit beta [Litoribacterium kuwaitense]
MLVSYKWLSQYVDVSTESPANLAEKVTRTGIEVEQISQWNSTLDHIVLGYVESCEPHPNADKLSVCQVRVGDEESAQIVCGAPNVAAGQTVIVARPGARLPGGIKIKKAKLRGTASEGMICSLSELGIPQALVPKEYADGIFVYDGEADAGTPVSDALQLDDTVIELELTANRGDCMSMVGVAYETAAILEGDVSWPKEDIQESELDAHDAIEVIVEAPEDNPLYIAKMIDNVTIKPAPFWMQRRLMSAGIRPINNVVDITNYVLLEYGQPLHAFDYDRLGSKQIVVRHAKANESMITLDGQTRSLAEGQLVITNGMKPIAMAGVMGGQDTEVTSETTTVLLEAAYFSPDAVRQTSRAHGLRSDSSARFEKRVDPERTIKAANRAAYLLEKYAGGSVRKGSVTAKATVPTAQTVSVSLEEINGLLGTTLSEAEVERTLTALHFSVDVSNGVFHVIVPTRRPDISIAEDLIEEVGRLYGYDRLPATIPASIPADIGLTPTQQSVRKMRRLLEAAGMHEAITYSLTHESKASQFSMYPELRSLAVASPMTEERQVLRHSLLPHLLDAIGHNQRRSVARRALYEVGSVYVSESGPEHHEEHRHVAGVISGEVQAQSWLAQKQDVDFFSLKGVVEMLFTEFGVTGQVSFRADQREELHPGRTASIVYDGEVIGFIGQLHPHVAQELDLDDTYVFELKTSPWILQSQAKNTYVPVPKYPAVTRDIALVVDQTASAGEIEMQMRQAGGSLLTNVALFDVYEGERLEKGKKSLAFSLRFSHAERTLTDEEVTEAYEAVLGKLERTFGAELRSS